MGDFTSTLTAQCQGTSWRELDRVFFPHSLGFLYSAITMYLGFPHYGDEYKVMGLAPYGEPEYADLFRRIIAPHGDTFRLNLDYFTHHKRGVRMSWHDGAPFTAEDVKFYFDYYLANEHVRWTKALAGQESSKV